MTGGDRLRPTPLELACGFMLGPDDGAEPLPPSTALSTREALRRSVRVALEHPPCVVAFSGGRDSSAMLALAVDVARAEGLPLPLPVTIRFPGVVEADETSWQEAVIAHLQLDDWVRIDIADELDYVGPYAQRVLQRHGLLWPANAYVDDVFLDHAAGGSLVDGVDGDSVLSTGYLRLARTVRGRRRPGRAAARDLRFALRDDDGRRQHARRHTLQLPWLTPYAQDQLTDALAAEFAAEPVSFSRRVRWYAGSRYLGALRWTTELLATRTDTRVVRPLLDPDFLVALGARYGALGFLGRTEAMRDLFGDLLPEAILSRTSKAAFPHYWGEASRATAAAWDGTGVDPAYVDAERLRAAWAAERVDHRTAPLLQSVWLARRQAGSSVG